MINLNRSGSLQEQSGPQKSSLVQLSTGDPAPTFQIIKVRWPVFFAIFRIPLITGSGSSDAKKCFRDRKSARQSENGNGILFVWKCDSIETVYYFFVCSVSIFGKEGLRR